MAENSNISWCDNRWNPWGPPETTERIRTSAANWAKPLQWEKQARKEGRRIRVFCASLADVFERNDQLIDWRWDLWDLVSETPSLDWQILTKRPENVLDMVPHFWHKPEWEGFTGWPANVWIGTSVENQEHADKRIPELLRIPAAIRFLSVEPLLGPVNLDYYFWYEGTGIRLDNSLHWVIVGGESGPGARPMDVKWASDLVDQCKAAGVSVFVKQLGVRPYSLGNDGLWWNSDIDRYFDSMDDPRTYFKLKDKKGGDISEFPEKLQVRQFPIAHNFVSVP